MRIMLAGSTYYPALNGQAIFTVNLAEGLAKRGHQVLCAFPGAKATSQNRNKVQLEQVKSLSLSAIHEDTYATLFHAGAIHQIFEKFQPEIIHVHDHYPVSRAIVIEGQKHKIRIIGTNHFMPENLAPYLPLYSKIKRLYDGILWHWMLEVYNRLDVATAQSRVAAELVRIHGLRIPVLPASCGIDLLRFHPDPKTDWRACRARYGIDTDKIIFLYVGRVDKEKRIDVLLHAMSRLRREDIQLVIAGHGSASNEFQSLAKNLGLGDRARFTGFIPNEDLHVLLNSVDIFVMASEAELLSIASLEAMACARPLLLADAVALPELVTQGVNGYLFKPGDAADVTGYIERLAQERERWPEMGKASLEKAQYHSLENTLNRYELLYQRVTAGEPLPEF
jgi:1,2-diacylglycerol 3-alpha-glucosyltransferase